MQTLRQLREELAGAIRDYGRPKEPSGLYDPVAYILAEGGKRIRPLLCACGYLHGQAVPGPGMWSAALALEVFHNFSLLHDDIMDEAPVRRGRPTVHVAWDVPTAILAGDVMLIDVYRLLAEGAGPGRAEPVLRCFHRVATGLCEGQQRDMDFERTGDTGWSDYLTMIRGKTAILLGGSLEIGALVGGMTPEDAGRLGEVGEALGMSFQLMDDWLDVFGDPDQTGKRPGGDILRGKRTGLLHLALAAAGEDDRRVLDEWYGPAHSARTEAGVERIREVFRTTGAGDALRREAESFEQAAMRGLEAVPSAGEGRALLLDLIRELQGRKS